MCNRYYLEMLMYFNCTKDIQLQSQINNLGEIL